MRILSKDYSDKDRKYYDQDRSEMLKYVPVNAKFVLDVGCSSGSFGKAIRNKIGCNVWGIEPDLESSEAAKLNLDRVFNSFFDKEINLENQKFDCIIFNDVLEHMIDSLEALKLCNDLLNEKGVIICSIPNIRFFDAIYHIIIQKDFNYVEAGIFDKTHLRFYTKKSVLRMFLKAGYKVNSIEGINSIKLLNYSGYKNFRFLNTIFLNALEDMEFLQFAIVVSR